MVIISCPAPFERLEVLKTPTIGDRTTRKPYESERARVGRSHLVIVIPGRREAANPESSDVHNFRIPGSREDACPGMTVSE